MAQFTVTGRGTGRPDYTSPVDIVQQTVANLLTVFNDQTVGVLLQPEWAVKEGVDKNFSYYGVDKATADYATGSYLVPVGKTLFLNSLQTYCNAFNAADRDKPQHFLAEAYTDSGNFKVQFGGDGGKVLDLTRTLRIDAGDIVNFYIYNRSNHNCNIGIGAQGYEI